MALTSAGEAAIRVTAIVQIVLTETSLEVAVRGSSVPVKEYALALGSAVRAVAELFGREANVPPEEMLQAMWPHIIENADKPSQFQSGTLQ